VTDLHPTTPRTHQFTWTPSGVLGSVQSANGLKHHYTRDTQQRVTGLSITDSANNVIETFGHSYNAAGRRTTSVEGSGRSLTYAYNNLHRLTGETISTVGVPPSGGLPTTPGTLGYQYDAVGNRLNRTSDLTTPAPGSQTFSYNVNDELTGVTYDLNGNPTTSNGNTDIYDFEDRLIRRTRRTRQFNLPSKLKTLAGISMPGGSVKRKMNGFFEFTPFAVHGLSSSVWFPLTGIHSKDVSRAQALAFISPLNDFDWHHHEVMGIMQAISRTNHKAPDAWHWGGRAMWSMCTGKKYK
jgi:YD repeat-containing protein